jgi:hypothetical protein
MKECQIFFALFPVDARALFGKGEVEPKIRLLRLTKRDGKSIIDVSKEGAPRPTPGEAENGI